jgi:hypothetical protein
LHLDLLVRHGHQRPFPTPHTRPGTARGEKGQVLGGGCLVVELQRRGDVVRRCGGGEWLEGKDGSELAGDVRGRVAVKRRHLNLLGYSTAVVSLQRWRKVCTLCDPEERLRYVEGFALRRSRL